MVCPKCNINQNSGTKFCSGCGASLETSFAKTAINSDFSKNIANQAKYTAQSEVSSAVTNSISTLIRDIIQKLLGR